MFNSFPIPKPDSGLNNIKSIQRGTLLMSAISNTVTIASVDITKSILILTVKSGISDDASMQFIMGELTNATTLTLSTGVVATGVFPTASWEVIEFNKVKSLQRGVATTTTATAQVTITAVIVAKSMILMSMKESTNVPISRWLTYAKLTNTTTLDFAGASGPGGGTQSIAWQVIEFN